MTHSPKVLSQLFSKLGDAPPIKDLTTVLEYYTHSTHSGIKTEHLIFGYDCDLYPTQKDHRVPYPFSSRYLYPSEKNWKNRVEKVIRNLDSKTKQIFKTHNYDSELLVNFTHLKMMQILKKGSCKETDLITYPFFKRLIPNIFLKGRVPSKIKKDKRLQNLILETARMEHALETGNKEIGCSFCPNDSYDDSSKEDIGHTKCNDHLSDREWWLTKDDIKIYECEEACKNDCKVNWIEFSEQIKAEQCRKKCQIPTENTDRPYTDYHMEHLHRPYTDYHMEHLHPSSKTRYLSDSILIELKYYRNSIIEICTSVGQVLKKYLNN